MSKVNLSSKLTLSILLMAIPIFLLSIGLLFQQSRKAIYQEATETANSALNTSIQRVRNYMMTVETATNSNQWLVEEHFVPDSLMAISRRIVSLNRHVNGCSITAEPDMFPSYGRFYSAYTIRQGDSVITQREAEYDYYSKPWYRMSAESGKACWIDPFDDYTEGSLSNPEIIASYCKPLQRNGRLVGVISTDLSLFSLGEIINSVEPPYPGAYFVLMGSDGRNFIHPDTTQLFSINAYSHGVTDNKGSKRMIINGKHCYVSYRPVTGSSWILALVCPDSEILKDYHQLAYLITVLIILGLLVILWLCRRAVNHAISPLRKLLTFCQKISGGEYDLVIPFTTREDAIGQLQNSFATMQQSLDEHMGSIRRTVDETKQRNEELARATQLAEEAVRQKTAFIQDVSHQIRTPLNIIIGFAQVLRDSLASRSNAANRDTLAKDEIASITNMMKHNSTLLNRMVNMLFDSSDTGLSEELKSQRNEAVSPNLIAKESLSHTSLHFPNQVIRFETDLPDDFRFYTNHTYLLRTLRELLYNAAKYSDGQHILLRISQTPSTVLFTVEDVGKGLPKESQDLIFKPFAKADSLSEGLGLGLPLSKRHAMNLGGDLIFDASYQEGCRFIIELPK